MGWTDLQIQAMRNHCLDLFYQTRWLVTDPKDFFRVKRFRVGTFIEDCRYHPCVIIRADGTGDIDVISLLDGSRSSCSLYHCGIRRCTVEDVEVCQKLFYEHGIMGIMMHQGWTQEDIEKFLNEWLPDGMQDQWPKPWWAKYPGDPANKRGGK